MSEENEQKETGLSTIKKTVIGIITTAITAAGTYVATHIEQLFGVSDEGEQTEKVEVQNNNTQQQNQSVVINIPQQTAPVTNTVIRETVREVPAQQPVQVQPTAPVEEPKETNAERMARLKKMKKEQNN